VLSDYFSSIGFEVVCPEDFSSFEEQVEYFNSVKILVSPTSAGIANGLLMQKNQTVVELEVPLVASGRETLHSLYAGLLFPMGHLFIMVPTMRSSAEIINKIKSNKNILEILSE
jgi:capsular polysaccharide biosynthesis protein